MEFIHARGDRSREVQQLRQRLAGVLGAQAAAFPDLAHGDLFDADTEAALKLWQSGVGLQADGVSGPCVLMALGIQSFPPLDMPLTSGTVARLFPGTQPANVSRYFPYVQAALRAWGLCRRDLVLAALATIRAETEGFLPISEMPSKFNTAPGQPPFALYDHRADLGNVQPGDGALFKGRGFVQLTGRANYEAFGKVLGIDLVNHPDWANTPEVASCLLAAFLHSRLDKLQAVLAKPDLAKARKLVNGGLHGLDRFCSVFDLASSCWPAPESVAGAVVASLVAGVGRVHAPAKGEGKAVVKAKGRPMAAGGLTRVLKATDRRPLKARKDAPDLRDRPYAPPPVSLLKAWPEPALIKKLLPRYSKARLILDQGQEGACTGFGLAGVVNHLRWHQAGAPAQLESVSARMLYNMARRYDEYAGENYEGSSCRGAIKGWFNHGVCLQSDWPYSADEVLQPQFGYAQRAREHSLGVYYRIDPKVIADLQAAIQTVGAVYVSAATHEGWNAVPDLPGLPEGHDDVPLIPFDGSPEQTGGHAFALVGFNTRGFILQNSWGPTWGAAGFAVLGYDDWLTHAMDAWVVGLGVPGVVAGQAETARSSSAPAAALGLDARRWWPEAQAFEHSVVLGNDGRVDRYLTEDERTRTLSHQVAVLPDQWFRSEASGSGKKKLVIFCHGGLNSQAAGIQRARVLGRYWVGNGCYPLFVVWKTGLLESIGDLLSDWRGKQPASAGLGDWVSDRTDSLIERTVGRTAVRPIWSEMKENASLAFGLQRGGDLMVRALVQLSQTWGDALEIHLVGHSAGAIWLGHLVSALARAGAPGQSGLLPRVPSVHLMAPACTVAFANQRYVAQPGLLERLHLSLLSDEEELNDNTASIYRKSLLYLVSNALEADMRTPILGLSKVFDPRLNEGAWDGSSSTAEALRTWRRAVDEAHLTERVHRVSTPRVTTATTPPPGQTIATAHGAFDNDIAVVSRTLQVITGQEVLNLPVDDLRGY